MQGGAGRHHCLAGSASGCRRARPRSRRLQSLRTPDDPVRSLGLVYPRSPLAVGLSGLHPPGNPRRQLDRLPNRPGSGRAVQRVPALRGVDAGGGLTEQPAAALLNVTAPERNGRQPRSPARVHMDQTAKIATDVQPRLSSVESIHLRQRPTPAALLAAARSGPRLDGSRRPCRRSGVKGGARFPALASSTREAISPALVRTRCPKSPVSSARRSAGASGSTNSCGQPRSRFAQSCHRLGPLMPLIVHALPGCPARPQHCDIRFAAHAGVLRSVVSTKSAREGGKG